jgi:hypothetical protein
MIAIVLLWEMVEFGIQEEFNLFDKTKRNSCLNLTDGTMFHTFEIKKLEMGVNEMKSCPNLNASFRRSSSNSTGALTPSTISECGDDSDYGLFEDLEDDFDLVLSRTETMATTATSPSNTSDLVIYTIHNKHAHVSCRSFKRNMKKTLSASISMIGERIVQGSSGLHAEYHVKMVLDLVEYSSWKTFNDFQEIAKACLEFSDKKESVFLSLFSVLLEKKRLSKVSRSSRRFTKTLLAWDNVIHERFQRNWFKQLSASALILESKALQFFLECLFFAIPKIDILLEFLV